MNLEVVSENDALKIVFSGNFLDFDDSTIRKSLYRQISSYKGKKIVFDAQSLTKWDSTLVAILFEIAQFAVRKHQNIDWRLLPENLQRLVALAQKVDRKPDKEPDVSEDMFSRLGMWGIRIYGNAKKGLNFVGEVGRALKRLFLRQAVFRPIDLLFVLEDSSYKAVGIVSLVSFMVGLILAFVGAIQLRMFGVQIYVASLVAVSMTRIMGAIMCGIIMAGRTGAAYAATIGSMQVNEEVDALKTMGFQIIDFLVLPRVISLIITVPILTMLADFTGILGGMCVGVFMLDIAPAEYAQYTINALNISNFLVGVFHGFIYGIIIALCGCYYGINSGRNAGSVGISTTKAVVSAIVWMIVATGIITWILEVLNL